MNLNESGFPSMKARKGNKTMEEGPSPRQGASVGFMACTSLYFLHLDRL